MQPTPPRTNLFTDTSIKRQIYLQYTDEGVPTLREITGKALDATAVDLLNDATANACVIIKLSPNDPSNAPLIYRYFIKKFLITDYHQEERVLEIRIEPWSKTQSTTRQRENQPTRVFSHGHITSFAQATVRLVTIHNGEKSTYPISSNVQLDNWTGAVNL